MTLCSKSFVSPPILHSTPVAGGGQQRSLKVTILKNTHTHEEHIELGILYTLVQHSGYGYDEKPGFKQAVEERTIENKRTYNAIKRRGGLLLVGYSDAYGKAEEENYPSNIKGIYPRAKGSFSDYKVDGLRLYIPQ